MGYQYPAEPTTLNADLTVVQTHHLMNSPEIITRRQLDIIDQGFIADFLLPQRMTAQGGGIVYETGGETLYPVHAPERVEPGGEYPLTTFDNGGLATARTVKWGADSFITDEAISRERIRPLEQGLRRLGNGLIRHIDTVALGLIASAVQTSFAASGAWSDIERAVEDILVKTALREEQLLGEGYDFQTIVLRPSQHAQLTAWLINSDKLPRESGNPLTSGVVSGFLNKDWVTSKFVPTPDPMILDRNFLGGIADEDIQSPGYVRSDEGVGIETLTTRDADRDRYRIRARRVCVPVVKEPLAAFTITGTSL
jgi:hypothetical protein